MESTQPSAEGFKLALKVVADDWLDVKRFEDANDTMSGIQKLCSESFPDKLMGEQGEPKTLKNGINVQKHNDGRIELHARIGNACIEILKSGESDVEARDKVLEILGEYAESPGFLPRINGGRNDVSEDLETAPSDFLAATNIRYKNLPEYFCDYL